MSPLDQPKLYKHWRKVSPDVWRWPHFRPAEVACRGTGELLVHPQALDTLEALRKELGNKPLIVNSGYRSESHNRAIGGAKHSKHREGTAFDISCQNHHPTILRDVALAVGFLAVAWYPKQNFVHVDLGPARSWGAPFPASPHNPSNYKVQFAPEAVRLAPAKVTTALTAGASTVASGTGALLSSFGDDWAKLAVVGLIFLVCAALFIAWRLGWLTERVR